MAGIFARERQIGPSRRLKRGQGAGFAARIGKFHQGGKDIKALARHLGDQVFSPGKVAIDSGGGDIGGLGSLGQGKAIWSLRRDQLQRRIDQRLAQVAMMVPFFHCLRSPVPPQILVSISPILSKSRPLYSTARSTVCSAARRARFLSSDRITVQGA